MSRFVLYFMMFLLLSTLSVSNTFAKASDVPMVVHVDRPAGNGLPLVCSVPFARGQRMDLAGLGITDDKGNELVSQSRVLLRWPDGSVRWAQFTVITTGQTDVLVSKVTKNIAPQAQVQTTLGDQSATLQSGKFTAQVDAVEGSLTLKQASQYMRIDLAELVQSDVTYHAKQLKLQVVEQGPIKTTLRLTGPLHAGHATRFGLDVQLTVYAGLPMVEVEHVLIMDQPELVTAEKSWPMIRFDQCALNIDTGGNLQDATLADEQGDWLAMADHSRVVQWEDDAYASDAKQANQPAISGKRLGGALQWQQGDQRGFVMVQDCWQQYPKGFAIKDGQVRVALFPQLDQPQAGRYANRENEHVWYFPIRDDHYTLRQGVSKSHRLWIGFTPENKANSTDLLAMNVSPVGMPNRQWLNATNALGVKLSQPDAEFANWDSVLQIGLNAYFQQQAKGRWYGLFNWGDWFGERDYNWGNHEYDTPTIMTEQGLRQQQPVLLREARRGATHYIDMDTVSAYPEATQIGQVWEHALGHTGGYYEPGYAKQQNYGWPSDIFHIGRSTPGHTRNRGVALAYMLTGNIRFQEHARMIGDHLIATIPLHDLKWKYFTAREPGWAMVALCGAYDATTDQKYLDAAQCIADIVLAQAKGQGVRHAKLPGSHNYAPADQRPAGEPLPLGALSFTTAFQSAGMMAVYERTGRKDIFDNLIATADYLCNRHFIESRGGFIHSPDPYRSQSTRYGGIHGHNLRLPIAFAMANRPENPLYAHVFNTSLNNMVQLDLWYDKADQRYPDPKMFTGSVLFWPQMQQYLQQAHWSATTSTTHAINP